MEKKKGCAHVQSTHSAVMANAPRHLSPLYGEIRLVDTVTVCSVAQESQMTGNTSSMATYLKQHHPDVSLTGVKTKAAQQPHITAAIMQPLVAQSDRVKASQTLWVCL